MLHYYKDILDVAILLLIKTFLRGSKENVNNMGECNVFKNMKHYARFLYIDYFYVNNRHISIHQAVKHVLYATGKYLYDWVSHLFHFCYLRKSIDHCTAGSSRHKIYCCFHFETPSSIQLTKICPSKATTQSRM